LDQMPKIRSYIGTALVLSLLAACGDEVVILPGEREALRPEQVSVNQTRAVTLPAAQVNAAWGHRGGSAAQVIRHPALGADLTPLYAVDIGRGDSRRARITSNPVVAGGVVYTMDARALVTASVAASGAPIWTRDLTPSRFDADAASGGAVTIADGVVYAATGFGELSALDAATGNVIWVQKLDAPAKAAPTVAGGLVYLVGRDSRAWALDTGTGRIAWQQSATPSVANFAGGASVAVSGDTAVIPFPSGEVLATFAAGGTPRWSNVVSGDRVGRAASIVDDIAGDPVIDGDRVYVASFGGRSVAFDLISGDRIWTAADGATGPIWPQGNAVFLLNEINQLVRLDAASGDPVWRIDLPEFGAGRTRNQRAIVAHFGPIMAGGRLIVASSDGLIRQFDPTSGALIGTIDLPGGAASAPVVADQTLFVISKTGQLHAFR
jgi:outer membrane protein assembly factor BamB